ncbi:FAD-dependent oxidoreductase [Cyanobacterium aponinum UTEX 3222]|uniref:flavin monoamine oxidase family protein n=1 Tax=Cyanobacterium aponinum TaxID=379064 RepID=UPI00308B5C7A|nr:FAD-dependent oxidoreductase [Cyanobacterium aponinum UTEX 3222]
MSSQTTITKTIADLLSLVENKYGVGVGLELLRQLGGHNIVSDKGEPPDIPSISNGNHPQVVIVGAGIAGLVLALELKERGAKVILLEASSRCGGRNLTIRPGELIQEESFPAQKCNLPSGQYFNAGPGRISHHHRAVLHYCRRFGLSLRPYFTLNRGALLHRWLPQTNQDIFVKNRQVLFDGLGRLSELAFKGSTSLNLQESLPQDLALALNDWLQTFGGVDEKGNYQEDGKNGYQLIRGGRHDKGKSCPALELEQILGLRLWYDDPRRSPDVIDEQLTMFEIEGGNDGLVSALESALGDCIRLNHGVEEIVQDEGGVTLKGSLTNDSGQTFQLKCDRIVITAQPPVLKNMRIDVGDAWLEAFQALPPRFAVKVAGWMKRRFWEEDLGIYGGITFTNLPIQQIWYPNNGFLEQNGGLLVLAYSALEYGEALGKIAPDIRCLAVQELASRIHPQIKSESSHLMTIAWQNIPYIYSPWMAWTPEKYNQYFHQITRCDRRIAFAGDWCSHLPAWQEGAIRSAYDLIEWALYGKE